MATSNTEFINNRADVLRQMNRNVEAYQMAIGLKAVELISDQMQTGYADPIRDTGDLMRDVNFEVDGDKVNVGNGLEYSLIVSEGSRFVQGRPYIKDALLSSRGKRELTELGVKNLSNGF